MQNQKSFRFYVYVALAMILLISSWEAEKTDAAVVSTAAGITAGNDIPKQSIRLRILANSDRIEDQWIKRKVRDAVVDSMSGWVQAPETIEQARTTVAAHLPDLERAVAGVLEEHGFDLAYKVELGKVPFPSKIFGGRVYPADDYEAIRVTLGQGNGQNWWCVLFPPLCFVDVSGDAADNKPVASAEIAAGSASEGASSRVAGKDSGASAVATVTTTKKSAEQVSAKSGAVTQGAAEGESINKPEVRFFLLDLMTNVIDFIKGLFS